MKKTIALLLSAVIMVSMLNGCRRQPGEHPGDPTVNNTTTTKKPTITDPTKHTTRPSATQNTEKDTVGGQSVTGGNRNRSRMIPHR